MMKTDIFMTYPTYYSYDRLSLIIELQMCVNRQDPSKSKKDMIFFRHNKKNATDKIELTIRY